MRVPTSTTWHSADGRLYLRLALMPPTLVLVGPPGAGKTTVGRALAARLGSAFRDTDDDVEAIAGQTISHIFVGDGEDRFRELERAAVATALAEHDGVLALGGGAVLDDGVRRAIRGNHVVYLAVSITAAAPRIGFNRDRPLLLGNPRAQWVRLLEARRPLYEEVATVTVDTDGRDVDAVVDDILRQVSP